MWRPTVFAASVYDGASGARRRSGVTFTAARAAVFSTGYPQKSGNDGSSTIFSLLAGILQTATLNLINIGGYSMQQIGQQKHKLNKLDIYRKRMRFSQRHVARLLGHKDNSAWSDYERGVRLPSLANALRLAIILRTPIEFLFYDLHDELRNLIRAEEERLAQPTQQPLF